MLPSNLVGEVPGNEKRYPVQVYAGETRVVLYSSESGLGDGFSPDNARKLAALLTEAAERVEDEGKIVFVTTPGGAVALSVVSGEARGWWYRPGSPVHGEDHARHALLRTRCGWLVGDRGGGLMRNPDVLEALAKLWRAKEVSG